jgi:hypothetical protein
MDLLREKARARGTHRAFCSESPDMTAANTAAASTAALSAESLAWAKEIYAETAPDREAAARRAQEVSDAQVSLMRSQQGMAEEYAGYQRDTFRPLERRIIAEAGTIDSEAEQAAAAGRAMTDVSSAFSDRKAGAMRDFTRMGVNPSDGQVTAARGIMESEEALGTAAAANRAREGQKMLGRAMRLDAANMGRGLPSAQTSAASTAVNAGSAAASNGIQALSAGASGQHFMQGAYGQAIGGMGQAGNLYTNIARTQQQANDDSGMWSALGSVAGAFISDETKKENVTPVDDDEALEAVRKVPVAAWNYKDGTVADDGGKPHVGPMAQHVAAAMGTEAAPGGKMIDPVTMNGVVLGAVRALDKKLGAVAAAVGVPA